MKRKPSKGKGWDQPETEQFFSQVADSTDLIARVHNALSQMRVPFYYSYYFGDALFTVGIKEKMRTHFFLPTLNTAIIVRGGYFYDQPGTLKNTALQVAMLQYAGVKSVVLMEQEINQEGVAKLLWDKIPELHGFYKQGGPMYLDYAPVKYGKYGARPSRGFSVQRQIEWESGRRRNWRYS